MINWHILFRLKLSTLLYFYILIDRPHNSFISIKFIQMFLFWLFYTNLIYFSQNFLYVLKISLFKLFFIFLLNYLLSYLVNTRNDTLYGPFWLICFFTEVLTVSLRNCSFLRSQILLLIYLSIVRINWLLIWHFIIIFRPIHLLNLLLILFAQINS
jgi:hypothetical protein